MSDRGCNRFGDAVGQSAESVQRKNDDIKQEHLEKAFHFLGGHTKMELASLSPKSPSGQLNAPLVFTLPAVPSTTFPHSG